MSITVLARPTSTQLTTIATVKAEFGIAPEDNTQDGVIARMIDRASSNINEYCNRPLGFGALTVDEARRGTGSQLLGVTYVPILAITQVLQDTELLTQIDPTDPTVPDATDGYYVDDAEAGAIYRAAGWGQTVALMSWGWEAYASRYILPGGTLIQRYRVTYRAGYTLPLTLAAGGQPGPTDPPPLPGAVEQACIETVKTWWFARDRDPDLRTVAVQSQGHMSYNLAPEQTGVLPVAALGLLRNHRRPN